MIDIVVAFRAFIEKIVKFFQDLVARIRDLNDKGWQDPSETEGPVA